MAAETENTPCCNQGKDLVKNINHSMNQKNLSSLLGGARRSRTSPLGVTLCVCVCDGVESLPSHHHLASLQAAIL